MKNCIQFYKTIKLIPNTTIKFFILKKGVILTELLLLLLLLLNIIIISCINSKTEINTHLILWYSYLQYSKETDDMNIFTI